jgi:2-amino-4-hydroxy-6-hydroxymethyldihydropteridine diphosphokinase
VKVPLSSSLALVYTSLVPTVFPFYPHRYRATIGIGGNVGNCPRRFAYVVKRLKNIPYLDVVATSPLLINPPFGYLAQDDFTNGIIEISTSLSPHKLLHILHYIENRFGRKRSFKNAPRTLDLDIIFFETKVVYNEQLKIPHPCWKERESVVIPLGLLGQKKPYRRYKK